jgi:hypothetical protein
VFTVGANRQSTLQDAHRRSSGTGGYSLYAESTLPILYDLNSALGRSEYSLEGIPADSIHFISFRYRDGDDASCLNLNRVTNPPLLGFDPRMLQEKEAFTFSSLTSEVNPQYPWLVLNDTLNADLIPAIADESVIIWGMDKQVGDTLSYIDETGETFRLKLVGGLANSVFQGNLLISEKWFADKYPSISGYHRFLVETDRIHQSNYRQKLSWSMRDLGFDVVPTAERLAVFNRVQNTYLSIFLILGGLGLILGSGGIAILVLRSVNERRNELAILKAVGFKEKSVRALVIIEHLILTFSGIILGTVAAICATLPAVLTPGTDIPILTILIIFIIMLINGYFWILIASQLALREGLISALRNE